MENSPSKGFPKKSGGKTNQLFIADKQVCLSHINIFSPLVLGGSIAVSPWRPADSVNVGWAFNVCGSGCGDSSHRLLRGRFEGQKADHIVIYVDYTCIQCGDPIVYRLVYLIRFTIEISIINHGYWSRKPTWLSWGPQLVHIYIYTYICTHV